MILFTYSFCITEVSYSKSRSRENLKWPVETSENESSVYISDYIFYQIEKNFDIIWMKILFKINHKQCKKFLIMLTWRLLQN